MPFYGRVVAVLALTWPLTACTSSEPAAGSMLCEDSSVAPAPEDSLLSLAPESLTLSYRFTPCFGDCPDYDVQLTRSFGTVRASYYGAGCVERPGFYALDVDAEDVEALYAEARRHVLAMAGQPPCNVEDGDGRVLDVRADAARVVGTVNLWCEGPAREQALAMGNALSAAFPELASLVGEAPFNCGEARPNPVDAEFTLESEGVPLGRLTLDGRGWEVVRCTGSPVSSGTVRGAARREASGLRLVLLGGRRLFEWPGVGPTHAVTLTTEAEPEDTAGNVAVDGESGLTTQVLRAGDLCAG